MSLQFKYIHTWLNTGSMSLELIMFTVTLATADNWGAPESYAISVKFNFGVFS